MTYGTASKMTTGQFREFAGAVLRSLPDDLGENVVQGWIENQESLRKVLRDALSPNGKDPVLILPADNEIFELSINGDAVDPLEMVKADGYDPKGWEFEGPRVKGAQTRRFRLVTVGYCRDLDEAKAKVEAEGETLAEGQWREAFKLKYPKPDRSILIGFGGSEWVSPDVRSSFPGLHGWRGSWDSSFYWSGNFFDEDRRWLVGK